MNKFKKLATLCMALVFSLGLTAFAACGTDTSSNKESSSAVSSSSASNEKESASSFSENSSESSSADSSVDSSSSEDVQPVDGAYVFVVKNADGTPAKDVCVQLCTADMSFCLQPVNADANGKVVYTSNAAEYVIHVYAIDENGQIKMDDNFENISYEIDGSDITPATHGVIYLTLK